MEDASLKTGFAALFQMHSCKHHPSLVTPVFLLTSFAFVKLGLSQVITKNYDKISIFIRTVLVESAINSRQKMFRNGHPLSASVLWPCTTLVVFHLIRVKPLHQDQTGSFIHEILGGGIPWEILRSYKQAEKAEFDKISVG